MLIFFVQKHLTAWLRALHAQLSFPGSCRNLQSDLKYAILEHGLEP